MARCLPCRGLHSRHRRPSLCRRPTNEKEVLHKEEGLSRRRFDADDRRRVANERSKHSHPLEGQGEDNVLYNIVNGKIAPLAVNVADAVSIEGQMLSVFRRSLSSGFHAKIPGPVKTLPEAQYQSGEENCVRCRVYHPVHSDGRTTTTSPTGADLLLSIYRVQFWLMSFGLLLGNKAALVNRLGIKLSRPRSPDIVIVDGQ